MCGRMILGLMDVTACLREGLCGGERERKNDIFKMKQLTVIKDINHSGILAPVSPF